MLKESEFTETQEQAFVQHLETELEKVVCCRHLTLRLGRRLSKDQGRRARSKTGTLRIDGILSFHLLSNIFLGQPDTKIDCQGGTGFFNPLLRRQG